MSLCSQLVTSQSFPERCNRVISPTAGSTTILNRNQMLIRYCLRSAVPAEPARELDRLAHEEVERPCAVRLVGAPNREQSCAPKEASEPAGLSELRNPYPRNHSFKFARANTSIPAIPNTKNNNPSPSIHTTHRACGSTLCRLRTRSQNPF